MKRKFWNWVKNDAEEERTLILNGEISDETWYGDEVTPKKSRDAGSMRAEIRRLEEAKVSDYESYKEGKLTREMFLERKKASDLRRQELSAAAAELEAQELVEDDSQRKYGEAFGIKEYLYLEQFDKAVMASLIESAKVMGEDRLEVTWKHQDVYEKILGEMQGQ